ncbi:YigZ family protein [bacterium]|nr:YigZ family protein [bacterium]
MNDHDTDLPGYDTLATGGRAEHKVRRSLFVAEAHPLADPDEVRARVADVARRHRDCRHVCHGWRVGHGADQGEGRSDGGEPAGTAGEPILAALRGAEVTDALVVVARWFGGVKLGTGGLGRAYRDAAAAALAAAPRRRVLLGRTFALDFGYELVGSLEHLLARCRGRVEASDFAERVTWTVWLPEDRWSSFARDLETLTHGRVKMRAPG